MNMQNKLFLIAVMCGLFAGCNVMDMNPGDAAAGQEALHAKIINTPENADTRSLLLYVGEDVDVSGSEAFGKILEESGALSCERVFPETERFEERARRAGLHRWYEVTFENDVNLQRMAEAFAGLAEVSRIEFNTMLQLASDGRSYQYAPATAKPVSGTFDDPSLADQWHYYNDGNTSFAPTAARGADVNVIDAWRLTGGDKGIVVAVIDEAVQYNHPDLQANMWVNAGEIPDNGIDDDGNGYIDDVHGYNFTGNKGRLVWNTRGDNGHGTHVAGTISAVNNNGIGVCGIAGGTGNGDGVRIMSCQTFTNGYGADISTGARAIRYAADNGAHIIQCSWGQPGGVYKSENAYRKEAGVILDAIDYFVSTENDVLDGGLAIFAAGNEESEVSAFPAAYSECISVTAFAADYLPAYYTNYGPGCNIAAPGGEYYTGGFYNDKGLILSTMPTEELPEVDNAGQETGNKTAANYGYKQGTSMACPHVSGVAALGLSYAKQLGKKFTRDEFTSMLLTSVNDMDSRLNGEKTSLVKGIVGSWKLAPYKGKMGSGASDAWQLLMQVEGTPCVFAKAGEDQRIGIEEYMGYNASYLTYLSVEIDQAGKEALGLAADPEIRFGKLKIHPTKVGSAKLTVRAVAGGDALGDAETMGGMEISKEISVISRTVSNENGGWL